MKVYDCRSCGHIGPFSETYNNDTEPPTCTKCGSSNIDIYNKVNTNNNDDIDYKSFTSNY